MLILPNTLLWSMDKSFSVRKISSDFKIQKPTEEASNSLKWQITHLQSDSQTHLLFVFLLHSKFRMQNKEFITPNFIKYKVFNYKHHILISQRMLNYTTAISQKTSFHFHKSIFDFTKADLRVFLLL